MSKTQTVGILLVIALLVLGACAPTAAPAPAPTTSAPVTLTSEDVDWLATVIASEAGSVYDKGSWVRCTDEERAAVGWTVLNRLRSGTFGQTIKEVVTAPGQYAHNQEPTSEIRELAKKLLEGQIPDATGGATHFFSPIGMPKEGESTTGFDIGGGLHQVPGIANKVYFPSWTKQLVWVGDLDNVGVAYFMFYSTETPIITPTPTQPETTPTGKIAFVSAGNIYIINPDGTGKVELDEGDAPVWSPDGKKIVYIATTDKKSYGVRVGEVKHLYVMNSDGTGKTELAYDWTLSSPRWSPSSKQIAYVRPAGSTYSSGGSNYIYVINIDGTGETKLDKGYAPSRGPIWSPDGRKIAYINEYHNLCIINADGTGKIRLVAGVDYTPQWFPDSEKIAYGTGFINIDGTGETTLEEGHTARWSPDGSRIAYIHDRKYGYGDYLNVMHLSRGGEVTTVAEAEGGSWFHEYSWSPEGKKLLYTTAGSGYKLGYHVVDIETGRDIRLRDIIGGSITAPAWCPDGEKLLYEYEGYVSVINANGTGNIRLAEGTNPQWSPDGTKVLYEYTEKFGQEVLGKYIYVINADGTGKLKLAEGANPAWSPASK